MVAIVVFIIRRFDVSADLARRKQRRVDVCVGRTGADRSNQSVEIAKLPIKSLGHLTKHLGRCNYAFDRALRRTQWRD